MNDPLISVIIPVYKAEGYLERCVGSIRNQKYRNLEIILVDDGSPDESGAMCDRFAQEDSRIRVLHEKNGGPASARNAGLNAMTGEYVAFVDSDDDIIPDMFRNLYDLCREHHADIACCNTIKVNDRGPCGYFNDNLNDFLILNKKEAVRELMENYRVTDSLWDKLYHKRIFEGLRMIEGVLYEDFDILCQCMHRADRVVYTGKPMYHYYLSQNSVMRSAFKAKQFDIMEMSRKRLAFLQQEYPEFMDVAYSKHVELGFEMLYRSRVARDCKEIRKELDRELRQILKDHPNLPMTRNNRIKVFFFRMGLPVFLAFVSVYYRIKGTQR